MTPDILGTSASPPRLHLFTIGVYGFSEADFFQALIDAKIDTFCDVRARRGVRGSEYAFANAIRLQARLKDLGICYQHHLELAPERQIRERQYAKDKADHVAKRKRTELSTEFAEQYAQSRLAGFDSNAFAMGLGPAARRVVLFCVEREPAACHRSLVAERLKRDIGVEVTHLSPRVP